MSDRDQHHEPWEAEFDDVGSAVIEPPVWVVKNILPAGLVFLAGPPKSRKSTLEMLVACLTAGYEVPEFPAEFRAPRHGRVMGWSAEATAGELRHMVESGLKIRLREDASILVHKNPFQYRLDDPDGLPRMLAWLEELQPMLAFVDPLRDFHALDEKDDGAMNRMLRPLQKWAKDNSTCFLVAHHARKRGEVTNKAYSPDEMRGTSALYGMADGILMTTPQGELGTTVSATFKRGAPWERTFKIGGWVGGPEVTAEDVTVDRVTWEVYRAFSYGAENLQAIARQLSTSKQRVINGVTTLVSLRVLRRRTNSKGYEVVPDHDRKALEAAFKKWKAEAGEDDGREEVD